MATLNVAFTSGKTVTERNRLFDTVEEAQDAAEELAQTLAELHLDLDGGDYFEWDDGADEGTTTCIGIDEDNFYDITYSEE